MGFKVGGPFPLLWEYTSTMDLQSHLPTKYLYNHLILNKKPKLNLSTLMARHSKIYPIVSIIANQNYR
jgi:hypothetical protein